MASHEILIPALDTRVSEILGLPQIDFRSFPAQPLTCSSPTSSLMLKGSTTSRWRNSGLKNADLFAPTEIAVPAERRLKAPLLFTG
jgi:hypothetical protein